MKVNLFSFKRRMIPIDHKLLPSGENMLDRVARAQSIVSTFIHTSGKKKLPRRIEALWQPEEHKLK